MGRVLMTTGYNFERYKIVKYLGVMTVNVSPWNYIKKSNLMSPDAFQSAINEGVEILTQRTVALGGNGMIGMQFQQFMITSMSSCIVCVATAVLLEKQEA